MKVPPNRKGNVFQQIGGAVRDIALNESPSEKEGKYNTTHFVEFNTEGLNESPSKKEGKCKDYAG